MFKIRFLLVSILLLTQISSAKAQSVEATVLSVGDGDTIKVKGNRKNITVRLACIDAPERQQNPWGLQSSTRLKQLLPVGSKVSLKPIETDRYGRLVAEVYLGNRSINTNLVQEGRAVVYPQYLSGCSPKLQQSLMKAEASAKQRRLGFWNQSSPVMPWEFRRGKRSAAKPQTQQECDPSYPDFCIPPNSPDLDCADMPRRRFKVLPPDPHGVDRDGDGIGCE